MPKNIWMVLTHLRRGRGRWSHRTSRSRCPRCSWTAGRASARAAAASGSGTVQYITLQYSTLHYSTVQYSTVQYSTVPGSASWSRWRVCAAGTCAAGTGDTAPHGTPSGTWQHYTLMLGTAKISRLTIMYHPTRGDTTFATSIFYSHFNKSLSSTICFKRRPIRCFKFQQIRKASFVVLKVAPLGGRARWKICNWHI